MYIGIVISIKQAQLVEFFLGVGLSYLPHTFKLLDA